MMTYPEKGFRVAICGCGSAVLTGHLPSLARIAAESQIDVVGIYDPRLTEGELPPDLLALDWASKVFNDLNSIFAASEVDVLVIGSPPSAHADLVLRALALGKHVACEKPIAANTDHLERIQQLSAMRPDLIVATVLQYKYAPAWRLVREIAKELGGPIEMAVSVERVGSDRTSVSGWRSDPQQGGIVGDHAIHMVALFRDLIAATGSAEGDRLEVVKCKLSSDCQELSGTVFSPGSDSWCQIDASSKRTKRRTAMAVSGRGWRFFWDGRSFAIDVAGVSLDLSKLHLASLSDRSFVNSLYYDWYLQFLKSLNSNAKPGELSSESFDVGRVFCEFLTKGCRA